MLQQKLYTRLRERAALKANTNTQTHARATKRYTEEEEERKQKWHISVSIVRNTRVFSRIEYMSFCVRMLARSNN